MPPHRLALCLALATSAATAQVFGFDDDDPATGVVNAFPFSASTTTGQTSLHAYRAAGLVARGLCPGAVLIDVAVAPASGTSGTYSVPQARVQVGHLTTSPPVPGAWTTHLDQPVTVHDLASGPYTFPWAFDTYSSLPGFGASAFVWDGVRDIGILITTSAGATGTFSSRRSNEPRMYVPIFDATTQTPTSTVNYAMEVRMTFVPPAGCALKTVYGTGCYPKAYSYYQNFVNLQSFDLGGSLAAPQVLYVAAIPSGSLLLPGAPAWFPPAGPKLLNNASTPGAMTDSSMSDTISLPWPFPFPGGSTSVVHAASDGFVLLGATTSNAGDGTPSASELLTQQPRLAPLWCDLSPTINVATNAGSGVYYDVDPSGQAVYITWLDCADARGTDPAAGATSVNVQCALFPNGDYEFRYATIVPNNNAGAALVGWSQGSIAGFAARDPGSIDISAAVPFAAVGPDRALALDSTPPRLGSNLVMTTRYVPYELPVAATLFGDLTLPPPGIDLAFLGAPACQLYTSANLSTEIFPVVAGSGTLTIPIPVDLSLVGYTVAAQSIALTSDNAFGFAFSNGLQLIVGS